MLKGFAITPVILGRISIGVVVERDGKRLPMKLDYMQITSNVQRAGQWVPHPVADELTRSANGKLHSIPVRIMFDRPENNFRAEYTCFDQKARPMCTGNGDKARRRNTAEKSGTMEVDCPGPELCDFAEVYRCKPYGRLIVGLEGEYQRDPLAGFMLRSTSFNTIRSLTARLQYLHALSGGRIAGMPCNLVLRAKSTSASMRQPIYYLDLEPREGIVQSLQEAETLRKSWSDAGLKRDELEEAVQRGIEQSAFCETAEDGSEVVEEFYNTEHIDPLTGQVVKDGDEPAVQPTVTLVDMRQTGDVAGEVGDWPMTEQEKKAVESAKRRVGLLANEQNVDDALAWAKNRFHQSPKALDEVTKALETQRKRLRGEEVSEDMLESTKAAMA